MLRRRLQLISLLAAGVALCAASPAAASAPARSSNPFCKRLGHSIEASSGAQMYCFGLQPSGPEPHGMVRPAAGAASPFTTNVDAASPSEDVSPGGAQLYGQSETSIAASGRFVVENWNDATSFAALCPSPMSKEEGTGFGFSTDGGATFTDEGGMPNANCAHKLWEGDPGVEAWKAGGHTYFYMTSLYPSVSGVPQNNIGLSACQVVGSGAAATIKCGQPIVAAASTQCAGFSGFFFCSFLDKDYLTLDPTRGRLYITYTEFGPTPQTSSFNGQVELAVCDLGTPSGGTGPAGGTAAAPKCKHGRTATKTTPITVPYMTLAPGDPQCQNEGAYPAVDTKSGDLYAAYEFNQATNIFNPACFNMPTTNNIVRVPASCLVLHTTSFCGAPAASKSENVVSLDAAFIPGYNRFPANDFPRIAVDRPAGTVSMVWNDASLHPLGDIFLRSYHLGSLTRIQHAPVVLNSDSGGLHFMPALRNASASGKLAVTWDDRASPNTAVTDVQGAFGLDPKTTTTPASNTLVTTVPTDWNSVSSDIIPNFGDYTDNYIANGQVYVAWSDGRLGVPQPFEASMAMP